MTRSYIEKHRSPRNHLAGAVVPDHIPDGCDLLFIGGSPSDVDVIKGEPMSGIVRETMAKHYSQGLGGMQVGFAHLCQAFLVDERGNPRPPFADDIETDDVRKVCEMARVVVPLGKGPAQLLKACGVHFDRWLPHPNTVREYGADSVGIVRRRLAFVKKVLTAPAENADLSTDARDNASSSLSVKVLKADEAKRLTYGVPLEPFVTDTQGDIESPEEIEKALHGWMERSRKFDEQHIKDSDSIVVEAFIAPVDFVYDGSTETVSKGSAVVVSKHSQETFEKILTGEIDGYSIRGFGKRIPA